MCPKETGLSCSNKEDERGGEAGHGHILGMIAGLEARARGRGLKRRPRRGNGGYL
jgi:hypothetical protein